jgi:hypothetical protein
MKKYFIFVFHFTLPIMITEQDKKFKEDWEKRRQMGRWLYGLKHGSVFGFVVFLLIHAYQLTEHSFSQVFLNLKAAEQLTTMVLAGITGYSTLKWWMNENMYQKIMEKSGESSKNR